MTHTGPMPDSAGVFQPPSGHLYVCSKCKQKTVACRVWESSCGGHEDYKYDCQNPECGHSWWVDGIDS